MKFILIMYICSANPGLVCSGLTQEFNSKKSCEAAKTYLISKIGNIYTDGICIEK